MDGYGVVSFEARQVFLFSTFGVPDFVSFKNLSSAKTTVILCGKSQAVCEENTHWSHTCYCILPQIFTSLLFFGDRNETFGLGV